MDASSAPLPRRYLPPLSALVAFEAAARHGSFTRAASELDLTQGAVSRQIKLLEDQLGIALFERARQRVTLTEAGAFYAREVREALQAFVSATTRTIAHRGRGGTLAIATLPTFGTRWLVPRIADFVARHPGIEISVSTRLRPFDLVAERLDAAIHFGRADWPGAEMYPLMGEDLVVVAAPAFARLHSLETPAALGGVPLLVQATRPAAWDDFAVTAGLDRLDGPRLRFEQFGLVVQAAVASLGVALVPEFLVRPELEAGSLVRLFDMRIGSDLGYYLVHSRGRDISPALALFRDWLLCMARDCSVGCEAALTPTGPDD
ncbi:LysR substrate-binding domain-containing protein [Methylobrevis albus]|uniref:LysR family transcriptional regulator n=1 Tax=Methylobrevis albus TaxID=2793297 RepID=A0A931HYU6_9HYPH|nr:LysR substrate-binding domain-containing protein [Methylobrevis albus]MBH0236532.1 LysR family transcriptional regulator [Methylobrevis albus]